MAYRSFKTFKTKIITFSGNEIIEFNCKIGEYTADLYFPEYNITVQRWNIGCQKLKKK